MVSPGLVATLSLVGLVLLIVPMLVLTVVGARSEAQQPPSARDESE